MAKLQFSNPGLLIAPLALTVSILCMAQAPVPAPVTDQESELGGAVFDELRKKGEIIESSPLYDSLRPLTETISRVAQPRYPHPFKFFLVHEAQPNAFDTRRNATWWTAALFREEHRTAEVPCAWVSHDPSGCQQAHGAGTQDRDARAGSPCCWPGSSDRDKMLETCTARLFARCWPSADLTGSAFVWLPATNCGGVGCLGIQQRGPKPDSSAVERSSGKRDSDPNAGEAFPRQPRRFCQIQSGSPVGDPVQRAQERA